MPDQGEKMSVTDSEAWRRDAAGGWSLKSPGSEVAEHIMQFFAHEHLPAHLQEVSKPFAELAAHIVATLPRNPERTTALRKLLEGKDAAVRARIAK